MLREGEGCAAPLAEGTPLTCPGRTLTNARWEGLLPAGLSQRKQFVGTQMAGRKWGILIPAQKEPPNRFCEKSKVPILTHLSQNLRASPDMQASRR